MKEYLYLEHDGKLLLVDNDGNGPKKPIMGRIHDGGSLIRLPTLEEVKNMKIEWKKKRENFRKTSVIKNVCIGQFYGEGKQSYIAAIKHILEKK